MSDFGATDLYAVLGVEKDIDAAGITKAYRQLAKVYHPDRCPEQPDVFPRVQQAYEVLSEPERRALFDEARSTWLWNQLSFEERLAATRADRLAAEAAAEEVARAERDKRRALETAAAEKEIQHEGQVRWAAQIDARNQEKKAEEEAAEKLKAKRQKRREKKLKEAAKTTAKAGMQAGAGEDLGSASAGTAVGSSVNQTTEGTAVTAAVAEPQSEVPASLVTSADLDEEIDLDDL